MNTLDLLEMGFPIRIFVTKTDGSKVSGWIDRVGFQKEGRILISDRIGSPFHGKEILIKEIKEAYY